jgi:hypothetical protein
VSTSTAARSERWRHGRHLSEWVLWFVMALSVTYDWMPGKSSFWISTALMAGWFGALWGSMRHARELCERCISRVPLDPQRAVNRSYRMLWVWHRGVLFAFFMVSFIASAFTPKNSWPDRLFLSLGTITLLASSIVAWRHAAIQPWCPWCRDDGDDDGGDSELVPDDPGGIKQPTPAT